MSHFPECSELHLSRQTLLYYMATGRPYSWQKHGCTGVNSEFSGWTDKQRTVRSLQRRPSHDTVHRRDYNKPFYKRMNKNCGRTKGSWQWWYKIDVRRGARSASAADCGVQHKCRSEPVTRTQGRDMQLTRRCRRNSLNTVVRRLNSPTYLLDGLFRD